MARNNYSYEKRHRELEKKKKKEAKKMKKQQQKESGITEELKFDKFGMPIRPEDEVEETGEVEENEEAGENDEEETDA